MTTIKLDEELLDGIEQFIADQNEPRAGRRGYDEAVNVIVQDWLTAQGYYALPGADDDIITVAEASDLPET
jgi:hypothetical protein